MKRTAVINVVGLTSSLIGPATPRIAQFLKAGAQATIIPAFPAVTCTAQSTYLTGAPPAQHGIVANGWYDRDLAEVQFWKQSNHLVRGRKLWDEVRELEKGFTCAKLFWWYNMYSSADYSITPRPMYPADGRKLFDIYSWPYSIRAEIKKDLGEFPFPGFWGPAAGVQTPQGPPDSASRWIAESARWIEKRYMPTLSLIYLPHLDYNLQRLGPKHPDIEKDLRLIDAIVGDLVDYFEKQSVQIVLLSEYGITPVDTPIHINRLLRDHNYLQLGKENEKTVRIDNPDWLTVKEELGLELLDCGASKAFAVADHQVAHVYLNDRSIENQVRALLEKQKGVAAVLDRKQQAELGIDHSRSGDLIALATESAWFTYYYWVYDNKAPDFARCVDIHRKPGYDPVELFLDPKIPAVKLKILWRLMQKKLGFRMLMDVIPLDATLVKGSHGCRPASASDHPILISSRPELVPNAPINATDVYHVLKRHVLY